MPGHRDRRRGERERLVSAHEVEDDRGAASPEGLADIRGRQSLAVERHIRPRLERPLARALAQVHRDDARRRELAQQLHGDVTETAYSDHDDRRSRDEPGELALDRAIRRQRGIRQRRRADRIELADRHEQPRRWDEHVLGEPAVVAEPAPGACELVAPLAEVLASGGAVHTAPAAPRPVDEHGLASR